MKIAIVGATGLVGQKILDVINEQKLSFEELFLVASERSKGKNISFQQKDYCVITLEEALEKNIDVAIFSAGSETAKKWAPLFADKGAYVIDNSSAWRNYDHIPLLVPGVNEQSLSVSDKIIANPNCSTIQLVLAIEPLHKEYKIKRLVVSTYQSVTGSGMAGVEQLKKEQKGEKSNAAYPHQIHENCIPHGGSFGDDAYTTEEIKLITETRKILEDKTLSITSTVVRVPVFGGHSASVNIEFEKEIDLYRIKELLDQKPEIIVQDNIAENIYPMPACVEGKDEVFVGRIRRDFSTENAINIWVVADNLRIGAATNAVRIMQYLMQENYVS
jgi:aspartate-semialdehyde dehydrogenase